MAKKLISANKIDGVEVPEHYLHDDGSRELDGVIYGNAKKQNRECPRVTSNTSGESLTKQSEATISGYHVNDVGAMVLRSAAGLAVPGNSVPARFIDVTALPDYQTSLNNVAYLENYFSGLHPTLRAQFRNDAAVMLEWLSDDKNTAEAVKMGLLDKDALPVAGEPPAAPLAPEGATQGEGA